jgi:hypothetical protein
VNRLIADKPSNLIDDEFINSLYGNIQKSENRNEERKILKFAHFTDLHLDLLYTEKATVHCQNIICCREVDGFPTDPSD